MKLEKAGRPGTQLAGPGVDARRGMLFGSVSREGPRHSSTSWAIVDGHLLQAAARQGA